MGLKSQKLISLKIQNLPFTLRLTLTAPFVCMVMMLLGFLDS